MMLRALSLAHVDNYAYTGPTTPTTTADWKLRVGNPSNWTGDDATPTILSSGSYSVTDAPPLTSTPTVTTTAASSIATTSAILGGDVTADGGATVDARGIVYSLTSVNSNPQIGGTGVTQVSIGSGTGVFSQSVGSLSASSAYSYNAYAHNSVGYSYGTVSSFTTPGPEINIEGNSTSIGDGDATPSTTDHTDFGSISTCVATVVRTFTIRNTGTADLTISSVDISGTNAADFSATLAPAPTITPSNTSIFQVTFTPSATGTRTATITVNNNDSSEGAYDFAIQGTQANTAPVATAPSTPTVTEDEVNVVLANDIQISDADGCDLQTVTFTVTGGTVTLGTTGITFGGSGNGTASFTAQGTLAEINTALDAATFTPTANLSGTNAGTIAFVSNDGTANSNNASVTFDIAAIDPPTVTTATATSIASTSATLGGEVTADGGATVTGRGIVYSPTDATPTIGDADVTQDANGSGTGSFSKSISGLTAGTTYYVCAYATNAEGTSYGSVVSFTTNPAISTPSGTGTLGDPYLISNLAELYWVAEQTNGSTPGSVSFSGKYFRQTADIDALPTATWFPDGSGGYYGWTPIGYMNGSNYVDFGGNYDGQNHTISNLYINRTNTDEIGLFGGNSGGSVTNLGVTNVSFTGKQYAGIFGYIYGGCTITNCYSTGTITATDSYIGGLVGNDDGNTSGDNLISNCYSTCTVSGVNYIGGLIGYSDGTNSKTITDCYAAGSVTATGTNAMAGGLISYIGNGTIDRCYSTGNVSCIGGSAGGFIGTNWSTVNNCFATGNVTGLNYVAGFVASHGSGHTISNCYSTGTVSESGSIVFYVGGFAGANTGTITKCYTVSSISGTIDIGKKGSFVGINGTGTINNDCFWNADIYAIGYAFNSGTFSALGKTTAEMQTSSTFTDAAWDFRGETTNGSNNYWDRADDKNSAYPFLSYQYPPAPEINVQGNSVSITDGDATPTTTDDTDFGSVAVASGTIVKTFTIQNIGSADLTLGTVSKTGDSDFTITAQPGATVAAGSSTTFEVTFDAATAGARTAQINIANDDSDENPYNFTIQGTGIAPEINVQGGTPLVTIANGNTGISTTDDTDFGSQLVTTGTVSKTFTIQNTGNATLNLGSNAVSLSGGQSGDFSVTTQPATTVAAGSTATFTVEFNPSATGTRSTTVSITNDDSDESTYTFAIQGTGIPEITVDNVSVFENEGPAVFTISLSHTYTSNITVDYTTSTNSAYTSDADYTHTVGTATIIAGQLSTTVSVPIIDDTHYEPDELYYFHIANASFGTITTIPVGRVVGTIKNDDTQPSVTLGLTGSPLAENGGVATVTATLSNRSYQNVTVDLGYTGTADVTDYTAANSIVVNAGTMSNTTTITGAVDAIDEDDESVIVDITGVTNGTENSTPQQVTATITDDDVPPTVSVNDPSVTEGDAGTVTLTFAVTLSAASERTITVDYSTSDVTAVAGTDYTSIAATTITFNPGETTKNVSVTILGDLTDEENETLNLNLTNLVNVAIGDAQGVGTITDNDAEASLSIDDVTVTEGNSGSTNATFTVTLTPVSGKTVTVNYATANNVATSSNDYTAVANTLTFSPGVTTQTITVPVLGDVLDETDETYFVNLSTAVNATVSDGQGTGTITDDDLPPLVTLSVSPATIAENDVPETSTITATLSVASAKTVTVTIAASSLNALEGSDYS